VFVWGVGCFGGNIFFGVGGFVVLVGERFLRVLVGGWAGVAPVGWSFLLLTVSEPWFCVEPTGD